MTVDRAGAGNAAAPLAVPPPPPGPGVQPPFVAPPTDGTRQRRWVAAGLAAGFVVLVCIGGLVGLGGLVVLGTQVVRDQAEQAVTDYLTALRDGEYLRAYTLLCDRVQEQDSESDFVRANLDAPRIRSFTVGRAELGAEDLVVPATISYRDQTVASVRYVIEQDSSTGAVEVCGTED